MIRDNLWKSHVSKLSGQEIQIYESSPRKVSSKRCFLIHLVKVPEIIKLNKTFSAMVKCLTKMISSNLAKSDISGNCDRKV